MRSVSPYSDNETAAKRQSIAVETGKQAETSRINCFASKSKAGKDYTGARKTNQDSCLVKTSVLGLNDFLIFGVYDGHGMHGHFASQSVKLCIGNYFSNPELFFDDLKQEDGLSSDLILKRLQGGSTKLLKNAYFEAESTMQKEKFDSNFSGTTAVTVLMIGNTVITLNAGDSRGILVNDAKSTVVS